MADDVAARIRSGILCFCAGDALGVPWQGMRPEEVDAGLLDELPARNGRAGGATSADTAQLLLLADTLACREDPAAFLARLGGSPREPDVEPTNGAALR